MAKYVCNFCNSEFAKPSNLNKHQRIAKYCVQLQEEKAEQDAQLTCEYCQRVLSRSDSLHRHYISCIEYLIHQRAKVFETEIANLKERLVEKERQLEEKDRQLWELTNTSLSKTTNSYTHIGQITINQALEPTQTATPTAYPLAPPEPLTNQDVTELINRLHKQVLNVFTKPVDRHSRALLLE